MELNELRETLTSLWDNAVSARTLSTYETGLRSFKTFVLMNNLAQHMDPLSIVSEDVLCLYIAHCYKTLHLRNTTIKLYLCGIRFAYLRTGVPCPLLGHDNSSVRIMTLLNAVKRIQGQVKRPRHPTDGTILDKICGVWKLVMYLHTWIVYYMQHVTAFFGFLRCGDQQDFDPTTRLCLGDLTFMNNHVALYLNKNKKKSSFKSNENIHKKKDGSYYVVSANKASSVTL